MTGPQLSPVSSLLPLAHPPGRMASSSCTDPLFRRLRRAIFSGRCALVSKPLRGWLLPSGWGVAGRVWTSTRFHRNLWTTPQKLSPLLFSLIENSILPSEYISICNDSHVCTYSGNLCHPHGDRSSTRRDVISVGLTPWHLIQCQEHGRKSNLL